MSAFFNSIFGGDKQSKRQGTASSALSTPPPVAATQRTRRNTLTDASTVASAFGSGDPDQVEQVMRRHEVRVVNSAKAKNQAQLFKVTQHAKTLTREDGPDDFHEMRTFHITAGANKDDPNTFHGTYFPMTAKEQGWSDGGKGVTLQPGRVVQTKQQSDIAISTPLTGCSVTDSEEGLGHPQPYGAPSVSGLGVTREEHISHVRAHNEQAVRALKSQYHDVFGPEEYGRYDMPDGLGARASTALVMADPQGNKRIMAQTVYGNNYGSNPEDQQIKFFSRAFGVKPKPLDISVTEPAPTQTTNTPLSPAPSRPKKDWLTVPTPKNTPAFTRKDRRP